MNDNLRRDVLSFGFTLFAFLVVALMLAIVTGWGN